MYFKESEGVGVRWVRWTWGKCWQIHSSFHVHNALQQPVCTLTRLVVLRGPATTICYVVHYMRWHNRSFWVLYIFLCILICKALVWCYTLAHDYAQSTSQSMSVLTSWEYVQWVTKREVKWSYPTFPESYILGSCGISSELVFKAKIPASPYFFLHPTTTRLTRFNNLSHKVKP